MLEAMKAVEEQKMTIRGIDLEHDKKKLNCKF